MSTSAHSHALPITSTLLLLAITRTATHNAPTKMMARIVQCNKVRNSSSVFDDVDGDGDEELLAFGNQIKYNARMGSARDIDKARAANCQSGWFATRAKHYVMIIPKRSRTF